MKTMIVGVSAIFWLAGHASAAQSVNWTALPEMVSKTSAVMAAQWKVKAAEGRKGYLARSLSPKVDVGLAGVAAAPTQNGSFVPDSDAASSWAETNADLSLNLWRGNQDSHKGEVFDAEAKVVALDASRSYTQNLSDARKAWLDAWAQGQRLEVLSKVSEQVNEDHRRAEKKANAGLTSQTDVMEFELRLQELDLVKAQVQESKDAALSQLASLLSLSDGVELGTGIERGPDPQAADHNGKGLDELALISESQARSADAGSQGQWPFPSIDAGFKGIVGGPDSGLAGARGYEARLGLTLSLWESGQAAAERNYFDYQSKALLALADGAKAERQIRQGFLLRRIERWTGMSKTMQDRLALAQAFRDKVSKEYARGVKDARDLEGATQAVANASIAIIEARSSAWDAWSALERLRSAEGTQP